MDWVETLVVVVHVVIAVALVGLVLIQQGKGHPLDIGLCHRQEMPLSVQRFEDAHTAECTKPNGGKQGRADQNTEDEFTNCPSL